MKFKNCAAWAKGWYKMRKNKSAWWMDLAHCINNDGWTVYSKKDVVNWILNRFDTEPEFWKKSWSRFGYLDMFDSFSRYYSDENLDLDDKIIMYFRSCLSVKASIDFEDGGFKPANWVLPYTLHDAWYDDGKYTEDHKPKFHFAEMQCDAQARVDNIFKDLDEQKPYYSFEDWDAEHNFDHIESQLTGKHWQDVVVDLGAEVGCEPYEVSGEYLNKMSHNAAINIYPYDYPENEVGIGVKLGRYSYSRGYDNNKMYKVYVEHSTKKQIWFDGEVEYINEHEVKKIEEL